MLANTKKKKAGFTLLEVLVAFIILGLSTGAILSIFSSGPLRIYHAENEHQAVLAAKSALDLVGHEIPLTAGTHEEKSANGIPWKLTIQPYKLSDNGDRGSPPVTGLYHVTIHSEAGPIWNSAQANIETLRLKIGEE